MIHDRTHLRLSGRLTMATLASIAAAGIAVALGAAPRAPVKDGQATVPPDLIASVKATLGLTAGTIVGLDLDDTPSAPLQVVLPLGGQPVTLDLAPYSVRSANYQVLVQVEGGQLVPAPPAPIRTLRGVVAQIPGSTVAGSRLEDGLHAMITLPDGDRYWVQPIAPLVAGAPEHLHVVYHDEDVLAVAGFCGTNDKLRADAGEAPLGGGGSGGPCGANPLVAELACDADVEYFNDYGSVTAVQSRINLVINVVNNQYESQVDISHEITTIIVRTSEPDPYTSFNSGALLTEFHNEWVGPQAGIQRDLAHLFTGKNLNGSVIGQAWTIGAVCEFANQYCHAQSDFSNSFACVTDLSAHELGHLWDAVHCDCPNFTMMGSPFGGIQCANVFTAASINDITAHRDSRTCLDCPCPENDDALEPNDSCAAAVALPTGTSLDLVVELADEDWYEVSLGTLASLTVDASFTHAFGDVDLELYDACGGNVVAFSNSNTNGESLTFTNFAATADFFLRVFLDGDVCNTYDLTTSLILLNDLCSGAPLQLAGSTTFSNIGASTDGPSEPADCNFNGDSQIQSDVWYRYFAQCDGTATVSLCGSTYDTKLAVYGADCPVLSGAVIACNRNFCGQQSEVSFPVTMNTFYRIRIGGHQGAQGQGTLTVTCVPDVLPCPEDINGDGVINVLDLIDLLLCFGQAAVPGCEAEDINADGTVNVLDLIDLLLVFGQSCP